MQCESYIPHINSMGTGILWSPIPLIARSAASARPRRTSSCPPARPQPRPAVAAGANPFDADVGGHAGERRCAVGDDGRRRCCRRCRKRGASRSPGAAKAIAALRALKHQREGSPSKGMNPNANAFQPLAAAAQSGQQIGDAANFMGNFIRPASSHDNVRASALFHTGRARGRAATWGFYLRDPFAFSFT